MHDAREPRAIHGIAGHRAWRELLPFLANGSLAGAERAALEAHLAACPACRAELTAEQALVRRFGAADIPEAPDGEHFVRILARVRAAAAVAPAGPPLITPRRRWGRVVGHGLARRVALVATLSAMTLGLVHFGGGAIAPPQTFHTLSRDAGQVIGADVLYVAFEPGFAPDSLAASLQGLAAEVMAGPTSDNVFTLRVPAAEMARAVATLATREDVRFVAPAAPGPGAAESPR